MKILLNCAFILFAASGTCTAQTITGNANTNISTELFINQAAIGGMKEVATSKLAQNRAQDEKIKSFAMMMVTDHSNVNAELKVLAKSKNIKLPKPNMRNMEAGSNVNNQTGNDQNTRDNQTGNNQTGNNQTGTNQTGNDQTGNNQTGTNQTDTNQTGTNQTGNNQTSNNQAGNNKSTGIGGVGNLGNTSSGSMGTDSLKLLTEQDISMAVQKLSGLQGTAFDAAYAQMMIDDHKNSIILFERGAQSTDSDVKTFASKHLPTLRSHLTQITTFNTSIGQP